MDKEILTEFAIPSNELNAEMLTGDRGSLRLEVEVIGQVDGMTIFRKHDKAVAEGNFKPETAKQLRKKILDKQAEDEE